MEMTNQISGVTVVSVFPFPIHEDKPGIMPRYYDIPAAAENDLELLIVHDGQMTIDLVDRVEKLVVGVSASQIAMSLIRDFVSAQLEFTENSAPGLFAISGIHVDKNQVKKAFASEIEKAKTKQFNWFNRLVFLADDDWSKFHQHRMISNLQRIAAKHLKLEREWLISATPPKSCPACGNTLPNPDVAICSGCGCVIDEQKAKAFKFAVKS